MCRYINADKCKELIGHEKEDCYPTSDEFEDGVKTGLGIAIEVVDDLLSANVIEIVRCRDCKHYYGTEDERGCLLFNGMTCPKPNDFCSCGERKDDA